VTIRPIQILAHSGDIASIGNGMLRSIKSSGIPGTSQFAQLWAAFKYNSKKSQASFAKCSKEQDPHG